MSEEGWEHEYPEGSLGWKINRKIDAIEEHALKSSAVFLLLFTAFFVPAIVEIVLFPRGPFFAWRVGSDGYNLAGWNMVCYVVTLLMFAGAFFYFGARLVWRGLKAHK